jgi:class 3 adenylate cyclase/tetratricopeptide (TPR) repeat protein
MLPGMTCSVCGEPLSEGARFCSNCGALVATPLETQERKMVTVLFADLVDSTGLARRLDPERAREVLSRFFDAATEELQALRGRPEKFIGDAVMAVFGLPHVHEDDALRAVRAGLAIGSRVRRLGMSLGLAEPLAVRVGIESGEAATGLGPAGQLLVTGTVVNAAARLQTAAEPGEILAGRTTHALTNTAVSFGSRRDFFAKGFDDELNAFPVEGVTTRSARRTIPFVGRTNELTILRDCVTRIARTGRPILATVLGESGIGKTRLADELIAAIGPDITVLLGRARSYADTATFAPAAAIVGDLAGIDGDPPENLRQRLGELVEQCCEDEEPERIVDRLARMFETTERGRDESAFVHDVQAGFTALVDGLSETQPVVLVFEDVQTLKPPMLDLIERLGSHADGARRRLSVALARPELLSERPTWGSSAENALMLRLQALSNDEAVELARQAGGGRIAEDDAATIASRTGGNPFFIVETTGMLLPGPDGLQPDARVTLPPTVQAVVSARLDALPARLRDLARRASVFVYSFDTEELALVDDVDLDELRELEEAEILVRDEGRRDTTPRWRIRHATLREVVYASLPKRERLRLHGRIAQSLLDSGHPSWAADHLELAALASLDLDPDDRTIPERAADALVAAGDRSRRRIESRSAVDFYRRALAIAGPEERWGVREARALAGMGEAHYWLGEYPAATQALDHAVSLGEIAGDAFSLALALRFLGDIAINVDGDVDKAEGLLDRSLVAAEELGDPWAVARTLLFAGWVPWTRRRYEEAEAVWKRTLDVTDDDDRWARIRALTSLSINRESMNDFEEALRLIEEASALVDESADRFSEAVTRVQKARVFEDLGRLEESLPCFDRGIAIFEELGARWELADATAERGIAKRELGRLDEAEEDLRHAIRISDEIGERQLASWTWRALARVAERRGDQAEAEERFRRAEQAEARRPK